MQIAACGLNCDICLYYKKQCAGCSAVEGKTFWAGELQPPVCKIYRCAKKKGCDSCKTCENVPCSIWQNQREPGLTDEEFENSIQQRLDNLKKRES